MTSDKPGKDPDWLRVQEEFGCLICKELNSVARTESSPNAWQQLHGVKFTGKEIGCGTYGRVFEAEYGGRLCAAKEMHLLSSVSFSQHKSPQDNMLNKFQVWSTLDHPCITQFIGLYYPAEVDKLPVIVMERMHSSLRGLVEEHVDIPMNVTLSILSDVCHGLQYLHSREPPIVHQNLTPDNILLCYHFKAKISDIGTRNTSQMADTQILSQVPGMNGFLSSESLADKSANDLSLDLFSFGRIILYVATHQWPQPTAIMNCNADTHGSTLSGYQQYLDKMIEGYTDLKPLVISCLDDNPQRRPSAAQASMEVKKVKIAHTQKLCYAIWGTEDQSILKLQKVQKQLYQQQEQQTYHQLETQELSQQQEKEEERQEGKDEIHQPVIDQEQLQSLQNATTTMSNGEQLGHVADISQDEQKKLPTSSEDLPGNGEALDVGTRDTLGVEPIYPLYIARYDYTSRSDSEMSFKRGDQFYIMNNDHNDWWYAKAKHSGELGCVPNNYISKAPLDAEDWFFGDISLAEVDELLMQPSAIHGSFLICNSEKKPGEYLLSVRYLDTVKHCEIYRLGGSVYLSPRQKFESICELVVYYNSESLPTANNQQVKLRNICPHVSKTTSSSRQGDSWETDRESICLVKKIETGKYSEVWEGLWNDVTAVAVKTAKLDSTETERLYKEMEILKQLSHPNMIELFAVCTKEEPIYIITELTKHGNLLEYVRGEGRSVNLPQLINMMAQIAAGMAYLGQNNYIHQDLAARNVMLAEGLVCKIADFSSARATTTSVYKPQAEMKLPIKWTALEVILYSYFSVKSDVWSFGILMYELITRGHLPYPGMSNAQVVQALKTGYRMPSPKGCPEQLYEIMMECWKDDAPARPTFEVLQYKLEELSANAEHLQLPSDQPYSYDSPAEEEDVYNDDLLKTTSYINLQSSEQTGGKDSDNDDYEMVNNEFFNVSDCPAFVAKYDYVQRSDKDLSFKKGDLLYILNNDDEDWWLAKNSSDKRGFIPSNHVVDCRSLEAQKWYFGDISRKEAEELLLYTTNTSGSFLIRDSASSSSGYSLSVRNAETVIHYKINKSDKERFHIVPCIVFESVLDLVTYYGRQSDGLCANLMYPCTTGEKPQTIGESEKPEDIEVSKESVQLIKKLGVGRFGEVWRGLWNNITPVAVKMLNVGSFGLHDFLKTAVLLKQLTHPKIIQVYAVSTKEVPIYIIMELMKYGNLLEYLKIEPSSLQLPQLIDMGVQVADGMAYLEEKNCIHRDISAKNIYVTVNHICKVAGMSITRVTESGIGSQNSGMSPVKWTAPEALMMHGNFTIKSDVWSFGILLYELITYGQTPYPKMNNAQVIEELKNDYRMPCPGDCPESLYEIMMECWESDPLSRPTFETLLYKLENFFIDPRNKDLCPDQEWQKFKELQNEKEDKQWQRNNEQNEQGLQQENNLQELNGQELQQPQQDNREQQFEDRQQGGHQQPPEEMVINTAPSPAVSSSGNPTPPPQMTKTSSITSFKSLKEEKELKEKDMNMLSRTNTLPNIAVEGGPGEKLSVNNDVMYKQPSNASNHPLFVGKYDYISRTNTDLGFWKGDMLYILSTEDEDWWLASNKSGQEGYIPSNHVAMFGSLTAEQWYFGAISRSQADKLLLQTTNENGSFLVRDSERASGGYCLSVKKSDEVIHYRVQKAEGVGYFVGQKLSFPTLSDLIAHYKRQQDGLCAILSVPCFIENPQTAGLSRETNNVWDINRKSIHLMEKLGAGQFGEVWHAKWNDTIEVAVKTLKPGITGVNEFLDKVSVMRKLRHPKVIQVYAVCTKEKPIYIITEFMKHGSLLDHLRGSGRSLELRHLIDIGAQVAAGMAYLEENNYIHRNLAARNVMMSGRLTCKVADYGLTRDDDTCVDNTVAKFMVKWTAPEAALYSKFSIKSDVWSYGILLYELISYGRFPYPGMNNAQVLEALQGDYRMPCATCCPEHLYKIMLDCWKSDPSARPTFDVLQCQMEEFFTETVHTDLFPNQVTNT